jgi:hypothetical protein
MLSSSTLTLSAPIWTSTVTRMSRLQMSWDGAWEFGGDSFAFVTWDYEGHERRVMRNVFDEE